MNNSFYFWEAMALACEKIENLAILLLDFEKIYNRADWDSPQLLKQFWKSLWGITRSKKIVCFSWLLVHRAILVNGWRKGNVDNMCPFCIDIVENTNYCLWSCDFAMEI